MSSEVEDFLAHYGVKGMRWGVRKTPSARQQAKRKKYGGIRKKNQNAAQRAARSRRFNDRVMYATTAAAAAMFVGGLLMADRSGSGPSPKAYAKPSKSVTDLINQERKIKISAIDKTFREGFIDKGQRTQFANAMNKRYDRKIAEALLKK